MLASAWVYIITNVHHTTLYVGVTNDLPTRLWEHRTKQDPKSFSAKYNLEVSSPGADQPFKVPQQYKQYLNRPVEVVTSEGKKVTGLLTTVNDDFITVIAEDKKQKKQTPAPTEIPLTDIVYTKPHLKF